MYFYRYVDDIEEFFAQSAQRHRGRDFLGGFWVLMLWIGGIGFWGLDLRELNHGGQVEPRRKRFLGCGGLVLMVGFDFIGFWGFNFWWVLMVFVLGVCCFVVLMD